MSKPSAPPPPDYRGAAESQSASAKYDQFTPYGGQYWSRPTPDQSTWSQYTFLAPDAQKTLDAQMGLSRGMGELGQAQMPALEDFYSKPFDIQSMSEPAYQAITSRLDPEWNQRTQMEETKLRNQGLVPGGEAYDNAMRVFNQGKNDSYQQATLASLQNAQDFQAQPLNIMNAIRTGAQVQNPQFGSSPGTNYLGAAQSAGQYGMGQYGNDVNQYNAMMGGLFGLGSAGVGAYGLMNAAPLALSDRRLKENIVRVGTHPLGIGIYEYDLLGKRQVGVMADEVEEVRPEAVVEIGGYKHVDYGML